MKKILSISLAFFLLISNMGFTMATHFCGGLAVKTELMIGHGHLHCGMPDMDEKTDRKSGKGIQVQAKPCCEDEYHTIDVEDDFEISLERVNLKAEFIAAYVFTFLHLTFTESEKPQFIAYSPPLLPRDLPVLNQVFLI